MIQSWMTKIFGKRLLSLWADRKGAILVEAAIVLPLLVMLFVGMVEFSTAFTAQRRVAQVASTIADLVTQSANVTSSDLDDIINVSNTLMPPYPTNTLSITISSVGLDQNGGVSVLWSYGGASLPAGSSFTLPAGVISQTQGMIVVQAVYTYTPALTNFLAGGVTLQSQSYYRPRSGTFVTKS